jgi:DNA mismatch repair protein MutS
MGSTLMRQTAIIVIMAQMGGFVPAEFAHIGVVDAVYSRLGASADNLQANRSTYMMEMTETAAILLNATDKSLVLLDEIGRGTSPRDGEAIAVAVIR